MQGFELAALLLAMLMAPAAPGHVLRPAQPPSEPMILRALIRAAATKLPTDDETGCSGVAEGGTVGDYLAVLVGYGGIGPVDGESRSLHLSCVDGATHPEIISGRRIAGAEKYWICTLSAHNSDLEGESPWDYELRFLLSKKDLTVEPSPFFCPGVP